MKRYIALLLAAVMVWVMAGCGSRTEQPDQDDTSGTVQPGITENDATGQVQTGTDGTDAVEDGFEPGSVNGGVYTNAFAGIGCELDEGWVFYTAEQMAELNGALADGTDNEDVKAMLADDPSIFDMYAVSTDGLMVMNVVVQNLGLVSGTAVSAQEYAEIASSEVADTLTAYGYENVKAQTTAADFAGAESCPAVTVTAERDGTAMYEQMVYLKAGNYIYCVTLCSFTEDVTAEMAELFYAVEE